MASINYTAIFAIVFLLSQVQSVSAQPDNYFRGFNERKKAAIDELKKFSSADTARVKALINVFITATFLKEREELLPYRNEALAISRKLNYASGLANCYLAAGHYYKSAEKYGPALTFYDSAIYIVNRAADPTLEELKGIALERKGMIYQAQENYYPALDCYFETLKYTAGIESRESRLYIFITEIYTYLNNLEKATEYAHKNLALAEKTQDPVRNASVYFPFINICLAKNDLRTASNYLDKLAPYMPDSNEVQINFGYYMKRGHISYQKQNYPEAFNYYQLARKYAEVIGHNTSLSTILGFLSNTALKLGHSEAAKKYAAEHLELAEQMNTRPGKIEALTSLSNYYQKEGDKDKAFHLISQALQLKDSLIAETNTKQINILGAIYESDKQQKQIDQLQQEKEIQTADVKQKTTLNKFFIGSIIVLLFFGYLAYTNIKKGQQIVKQQQALQKQKISELEKDKQLLSIDAMLKGQEEERSRIAKDLHDGLGGLLSGTKLSFMNVKENLMLSPENAVLFDKSLSMLDNTIGDLRKVAHNLMPEALVKFGLQEALRDFCDAIQLSSGIQVTFQHFGEGRKLSDTAEVFTYRIFQELVNNAVKYAAANEILVQLSMNENKTGITVEDNGKGFDKSKIAYTKGSGMANIEYRVQYFNGNLDIVTSPGNGTSVNIVLLT